MKSISLNHSFPHLLTYWITLLLTHSITISSGWRVIGFQKYATHRGFRIRIRCFCLDPDPVSNFSGSGFYISLDPDPVCPERLDPESGLSWEVGSGSGQYQTGSETMCAPISDLGTLIIINNHFAAFTHPIHPGASNRLLTKYSLQSTNEKRHIIRNTLYLTNSQGGHRALLRQEHFHGHESSGIGGKCSGSTNVYSLDV